MKRMTLLCILQQCCCILWAFPLALLQGCSDSENVQTLVSPESATVEMAGGEVNITVTMDGEVKTSVNSWIEKKGVKKTGNEHLYTFEIKPNFTGENRTGEIIFTNNTLNASTTILQKGEPVYTPSEDLTGIEVSAKLVKPLGGRSSDERPSAPFSRVWDGIKDKDVYYSEYANGRIADFPVNLDLYFDESLDFVDHIIYYAPNNGVRGSFGKTRILVSKEVQATQDDQFEEIGYVDLKMKNGAIQKIAVTKEIKGVKTVRLSVEEGAEGTVGAMEIEVYTRNLTGFDPSALFTDATCSELKPGIGEKEIEASPYPFFKNMATHMLKGSYPREFRIGEYIPYQHPDVQAKTNKTTSYSLLDNPTGISVSNGETLIVLVGETYGEEISLRITDWDGEQSATDGYGSYTTYFLQPGLNKLENCRKGLAYVMYHTDNYLTAQPVKVHIASGTVNGYYHSEKHQPAQWPDLLGTVKDKHFDVLGKYVHIVFPTTELRKVSNISAWIDFYDNLVYEQQIFMGLEKYNRMFNNRMLFNVMYSNSYMYSAAYHTAYSKGTIADLCNLSKLVKENWGPAHEVGHSNQTRPGLKWHGMTEVTNNIMAMYIQRITSGESRLLKQTKYAKAMTDAFCNNRPFIEITRKASNDTDVFCLLVPFWQLQLYMEYVLDKKDFYKDVYEAVRIENNKDAKKQAGEIQLDFAYKCCVAAGLDLSDFFERWGFFREVTCAVHDYGEAEYKVTATYAKKIKQDIAALNLPKPKHKFEYICELTENVYKEGGAVIRGSVSQNGNTFTMSGWQNVAAFEVYDNLNKLIFISPQPTFKVDNLPGKFTVKAIAADGTATAVSF